MVQSRSRKRQPIELSDIAYDSTCISLGIIQDYACAVCQPKLDIHTKKGRIQKSKERLKNVQNRCEQPWLSKWKDNQNATEGGVLKYQQVRNYLGLESNVVIDFKYVYGK